MDPQDESTAEETMQRSPKLFCQSAISQLTSSEQRNLLDAIDKLRNANVSGGGFSIPQIVVCGDQSAGKSSVLEAISQLRFPVRDGEATTKFVTEVVLRNDGSALTTPVTLKLLADKDRTPEQKAYLKKFRFAVDVDDPEAFTDAVNAALEFLRLYEPKTKFWYDRLHVEILGPKQPNLTLVDLPGLFQLEHNANDGDKERVKDLVKRYISEPKAIILAVVTAVHDVFNQEIIQLVRDSNGALNRTIGVLTKSDLLVTGSTGESAAIQLASNKKITLGLGWHVFRNMEHQGDTTVSYEHRDEAERKFFSKLPWSQIGQQNTGVIALREKLSQRLFGYITHDLPAFVSLMDVKLTESRSRRDKLGAARNSPESQAYYLHRVQRDLQDLIQDSLNGRPEHSRFTSFFDGSSKKALRTTINRYSHDFALKIRKDGKQWDIYDTEE